jgi:hypothetical protein
LVENNVQQKLFQVPNGTDASPCDFRISIPKIAIKVILALSEIY